MYVYREGGGREKRRALSFSLVQVLWGVRRFAASHAARRVSESTADWCLQSLGEQVVKPQWRQSLLVND